MLLTNFIYFVCLQPMDVFDVVCFQSVFNLYCLLCLLQLNRAEEDSSLLRSSSGQYGADTGRLGNIQAFNDDSDEDILQL